MTLFDRIVVVDWSAASRPTTGRDSIWVGRVDVTADPSSTIERWNPPTRAAAVELLVDLLASTPTERTLLGVDLSLGHPRGTAAATGLAGAAWEATWRYVADELTDDERNRNDRFEVADRWNRAVGSSAGPFWGRPSGLDLAHLPTRKVAPDPLPEWRLVEDRLRATGHRPFSAWQLLGAGSVGSQMLTGIAALSRLRADPRIGRTVDVWPFTTGARVPPTGPRVVVAEVWPTLVAPDAPTAAPHLVRDEAQVVAVARRLAGLDATGSLTSWFRPSLTDTDRRVVEDEEGWTLGVL